jgi:putative holliday junction resolvase
VARGGNRRLSPVAVCPLPFARGRSADGDAPNARLPAAFVRYPADVERFLGLDFGDRRIGVAVSDELGLTAQPVLTLLRKNTKQDLKSLGRLLRKFHCAAIVLGNPLYMSGDLSPQAAKTQAFAASLREAFALPVHLWDERLTSAEAHRHLHAAGRPLSGHREVVDQVAAVLILQGFLDARRASTGPGNGIV